MTEHVYTDGENLFVARSRARANELFKVAFGGDTPRDYGCSPLKKLPPRAIVDMGDEDNSVRMWASTLAKDGEQTILTQ